MTLVSRLFGDRESVAPPLPSTLEVVPCLDDGAREPPPATALQPISGFTCVIQYDGVARLISCRRYKTAGKLGYVCAVCLTAKGFREFRTDRIEEVFDPVTGESLGTGEYFGRFAVDEHRDVVNLWGLTRGRHATLVGGLNVLAFMAQCDGHWHRLEREPVERFVCSLWLKQEWDGEPPLADILAHAQRLSPDSDTFFEAIADYARSETRSRLLMRAVTDLIEADGVVCDEEFDWARALLEALQEAKAAERIGLA